MSIFVTPPILMYLRTQYLNLSDQNRVIDIHNIEGLKLLIRMRLRVSHLADHKLDIVFNLFVPKVPFLYPLKTSQNLPVFWCFKGAEKECIGSEWVKIAPNKHTTSNQRRFDVDITSIRPRPNFDELHVIVTYFFGVISPIEKSTSFPHTFFDVIWLVEKPALFPRTFFDVISMVEKYTLFPHTFYDVIRWSKNPHRFHVLFSM